MKSIKQQDLLKFFQLVLYHLEHIEQVILSILLALTYREHFRPVYFHIIDGN